MNREKDPVIIDLERYLTTQEEGYVSPLEAEIQYEEHLADIHEGDYDAES
jgi:hypothetical protein